MPKVTSVYYQRLETIPGRFANETYGVTVTPDGDTAAELAIAWEFAKEEVAMQHHNASVDRTGLKDMTDWRGLYDSILDQFRNLQANHATALRNIEDMKSRLRNASDLLDLQLEEVPF